MEIRHLRYFVAVAEELHFTRAAERLGIKQPPLSLQIRNLEREMGTPLFRRLTRGVELTEAGALLLDDARRILAQLERTKASVQSRARGDTGRINLGFAHATYFQRLVPGIIRAFRQRYPGVLLLPEEHYTPRLIESLRNREIDVAFVRPPIGDSEGLVIEPLIEEHLVIAVPKSHPQADNHFVALATLAQETWTLLPRSVTPDFYDAFIARCRQAGFGPKLGQEAPQVLSLVPMVAAGFGVSIVPESLKKLHVDGVAYLRVKGDKPHASISLAYRRDDHSTAVRNFVTLARRIARPMPRKNGKSRGRTNQ